MHSGLCADDFGLSTVNAKQGLSGLPLRTGPLQPAPSQNATITPLQSALTCFLDLKSFRIRTYEKNIGGRGVGEVPSATPPHRSFHSCNSLTLAPCALGSALTTLNCRLLGTVLPPLSPLFPFSSALFALFHTRQAPSNSCLLNRLRTLSRHNGGVASIFRRRKQNGQENPRTPVAMRNPAASVLLAILLLLVTPGLAGARRRVFARPRTWWSSTVRSGLWTPVNHAPKLWPSWATASLL